MAKLADTVHQRIAALLYPEGNAPRSMEQFRPLNFLERSKVRAIEEDFADDLAEEHLSSIAPQQRKAIASEVYRQASQHPEARGYADVESHYRDFARIATAVHELPVS